MCRVKQLSNGTDDLSKNNTVAYSGALQQVQKHTLIEIKVIHHIDLNDSDTSKKKRNLYVFLEKATKQNRNDSWR